MTFDAPSDSPPPPPQSIAAEKAVLGAIFVNNSIVPRLTKFLEPRHFIFRAHGRIFDACRKLAARGRAVDPVILAQVFANDQAILEVGGPGYLADLASSAVTPISAIEYGRYIRDCADRRLLIAAGEALIGQAMVADGESSAADVRARHEAALADIGIVEARGPRRMDAVVDSTIAAVRAAMDGGTPPGVSTGLVDIDRALGSLGAGDLVVIAGATGMGKTAMATGMALAAAKAGTPALVFSLEMPGEKIALRDLAARSGLASRALRHGRVDAADLSRLDQAADDMRALEVWIDDRPGQSVDAISATARSLARSQAIGLVVVDYLQLVTGTGENRTQEVGSISKALKVLAMDLGLPVIALSQLSRAHDARDDKRPHLSDLRESGSIEQDADTVLFIYRPSYYLERETTERRDSETDDKFAKRQAGHEERLTAAAGKAEIIIAKARDCEAPKTVIVRFDGRAVRFQNWINI